MPKISNTTEYPKLTSDTVSTLDFLPGTQNSTGLTKNFPLGAIAAIIQAATVINDITLDEADTYQNDSLIGKTGAWAFYNGQHLNTINYIDSFDSDTGTITFNSDYTPLEGEMNILYF